MSRVRFPAGRVPMLYGLNHVLTTGQSLALGYESSPALSTTQPFANKMFVGGVDASTYTSLVPLIEGTFPVNLESPSSGFANLVSDLSADIGVTHDALISSHAESGTAYTGIKKGTAAFTRAMAQVTAGAARAAALSKTYGVTAIGVVHGEADALLFPLNLSYESQMVEFQADYEADVFAITGQSGTLPMFLSQYCRSANSDIPLAQYRAHVNNPGKIVLIGPKYHLEYVGGLGLHISAVSSRQLGEEFARAYYQHVVLGRPWEPLRPVSFSTSGNQLTMTMHVPAPPLVWDTTLVGAQPNYGFTYTPGGGGSETITSVEIVGVDQIRVTLSGTPSVWGTIKYGVQTTRGNLRDSDATPSRHGYSLFNWCCIFKETVTP